MQPATLTYLRRAAVVSAGLAIVVASLLPQKAVDIEASDKLLHGLAYAIWAALAALSPQPVRRVAIYLLVIIAVGVMVELVQPFVGRQDSLLDIAANLAGVLAGAVIGRIISARLPHVSKS